MKIAFPLIDQKELAIDFAHSNYIGIFDDEKNKTDLLPIAGVEKNIGIEAFFDAMTSAGLNSVISPYYSFLALRVFKENNIETYKAMGTDLQDNIDHFKANSLKSFELYKSVTVSSCTKECSSCGPVCTEV